MEPGFTVDEAKGFWRDKLLEASVPIEAAKVQALLLERICKVEPTEAGDIFQDIEEFLEACENSFVERGEVASRSGDENFFKEMWEVN